MKKYILILITTLSVASLQAQTTIREVFTTMPDSIFPMLTKNNRLDMVDFLEARMRAEVNNLLDGSSELLSISRDSLTLRTSPVMTATMYVLSTEADYDSCKQVVCLERTYTLPSDSAQETVRTLYTTKWRPLQRLSDIDEKRLRPLPASTILKRDDEVFDERRRRIE
jgi:hypothetical protein